MVERLFLVVLWDCLRFVIVVFLDHTHLLFCVNPRSNNMYFHISALGLAIPDKDSFNVYLILT